jgi:peptidoglycan biosynthesis protein MviN/MurJ (putative lipid II flippase)
VEQIFISSKRPDRNWGYQISNGTFSSKVMGPVREAVHSSQFSAKVRMSGVTSPPFLYAFIAGVGKIYVFIFEESKVTDSGGRTV